MTTTTIERVPNALNVERSIRGAVTLAAVGWFCFAASVFVISYMEKRSVLRALGDSYPSFLWFAFAMPLRKPPLDVQRAFYWLYLILVAPIAGVGLAVALFLGFRFGFPTTGHWVAEFLLWTGAALLVMAGIILIRSRAHTRFAEIESSPDVRSAVSVESAGGR